MTAPEYRRTMRHAPKTVIDRAGRQRLMHGEPLCGKPVVAGSTTSLDAYVDCDDCIELMERSKK